MSTITEIAARAHGMSLEAYQRDVCPVLFALLDAWGPPLELRERVALLAYEALGTAGDGQVAEARRWSLRAWMVTAYAPIWIEAAGFVAEAQAVRASWSEEAVHSFRGPDWTESSAAQALRSVLGFLARPLAEVVGKGSRRAVAVSGAMMALSGGDAVAVAMRGAWDPLVWDAPWDMARSVSQRAAKVAVFHRAREATKAVDVLVPEVVRLIEAMLVMETP